MARRPHYRVAKRKQAAELYAQGLSLAEVGERIGVSKERVRQYLDDEGVRRRGQGRAPPPKHKLPPLSY